MEFTRGDARGGCSDEAELYDKAGNLARRARFRLNDDSAVFLPELTQQRKNTARVRVSNHLDFRR
jgi:hypothetical protein